MLSALLTVACAAFAAAEYQNFQDPLVVAPVEEQVQDLHDLARASDATIFIAYTASAGAGGLFVRRSHDEGATWSRPGRVFRRLNWSQSIADGQLAVDVNGPNTLCCVFACAYEGIVSSRSDDGGEIWSDIRIITEESSAKYPELARNPQDGTLVVIYTDRFGQHVNQQYVSRSTDRGETWSAPGSIPKIIPDSDSWIDDMEIDAGGTLRLITVSDGNPYLTQSSDNGVTWSSPSRIGPPDGEPGISDASLLVADGSLHVVYAPSKSLNYVYSDDDGLTWSNPLVVDRFTRFQDIRDLTLMALPDGSGMMIGYLCPSKKYSYADNIHYQVLRPGTIGPRRRINNTIRAATEFCGFLPFQDGSLMAVYGDETWTSQFFTTAVVAWSIPDDPHDFGVTIDEDTALKAVDPGISYTLSFDVGNWTDAAGPFSAFITAQDRDTGHLTLLDQQRHADLQPGEQKRLDATLRVPDWIGEGDWDLRVSVGPELGVSYDSDGFRTGVYSD